MAGRGTDIKLGGNKDFIYDGKKENPENVKINEEKVKSWADYLLSEQNGMRVEELIISLEVGLEDKAILEVQFFL